MMTKRFEALKWASSFLEEKGRIAQAGELFLCEVLGISKTQLYASLRENISDCRMSQFQKLVTKHGQGIPVQHLLGFEWFYGRKFKVNGDVLIPRPETEELVQGILQRATLFERNGKDPLRVCDVGTGSGAIAITLALESEQGSMQNQLNPWDVTAVDISKKALMMAEDNARELGAKVRFLKGNLLEPLIAEGRRVDIVVSNPPYIPESDLERLDITVKGHEPHLALFGGSDGYRYYRELVAMLPEVLGERMLIGFEIGHGQGSTVAQLLMDTFKGQILVEVCHDINGKERMVFGGIPG